MLGATRLTRGAHLADAVRTIQDALGSAAHRDSGRRRTAASPDVRARAAAHGFPGIHEAPPTVTPEPASAPAGTFERGSYAGRSGTRSYKLFRPAGLVGPAPLVVMLHGCKQDPDDFAAGTRMNALAAERGFLVLYPEQAPRSNASKCWNWFAPGDQQRGRGEPDLLAGMTHQVIGAEPVDPSRVYVAGLSAGGAMAAILAREYPDVFAAAGVHSGLPPGAAHDVASAFAAMSQGAPEGGAMRAAAEGGAAPLIVFHGDRDRTVHPVNADRVIDALLGPVAARDGVAARSEAGSAGPGARRRFTRTVYRRAGETASRAELWVVHGAGHAWAGGSADGSFTDPRGPDASREFFRFFDEHRRRLTA
ncbi:PHB depolymerase family esterase [Schlegelella sp. ID0723]|uniref:PHB depolymerase family esterase n=2 Tax=Piscinibacter koreensis TaxID=2742824 RepID=A0A7Y6NJN0_9BURK|nr:PHB depolymerase family esterase [Schlegelella koreensis]